MIVDRLKKSSYFISVKSTYMAGDYARIYIDDIVSINGISFSSYRIEVIKILFIFEGLFKKVWVLE